jgi:hypothetical protein
VTGTPRPQIEGFWRAELERLTAEQIAKTGTHLVHDPDPWLFKVADQTAADALAQMRSDMAWIHQRNREDRPRLQAKETVARIEADVAAKRERDLARARLSNRMAIRLSGILEWSP